MPQRTGSPVALPRTPKQKDASSKFPPCIHWSNDAPNQGPCQYAAKRAKAEGAGKQKGCDLRDRSPLNALRIYHVLVTMNESTRPWLLQFKSIATKFPPPVLILYSN